MAREITGHPYPPRFTSGPATRHALAVSGALGATTGAVVHLAAAPTGAPASATVLAHELAHARRPVRRPRFLLAGTPAPVDDDERDAVAAGQRFLGGGLPGRTRLPRPDTGTTAAGEVGAGIVDRLPVGAGLGAVGDLATRAARAAVLEASAVLPAHAEVLAGGGAGPPRTVPEPGGTVPVEAAGTPVAGVSTGPPPPPGRAGQATPPQPGGAAPLDADRVIELVEQRLQREIERRGGRWAGVF